MIHSNRCELLCSSEERCQNNTLIKKAAEIISKASFLLITCGAGFSQDSGLAVYKDIANHHVYKKKNLEYHDLARPVSCCDEMLLEYYGFWIHCAQTYSKTSSHSGYEILQKWKEKLLNKKIIPKEFFEKQKTLLSDSEWFKEEQHKAARNVFVYSSNVDNHFSRYFNQEEIYNIHGHVFNWQCGKPCSEKSVWKVPNFKEFEIDEHTMEINSKELQKLNCPHCQEHSMPNVLMFGDLGQYIRNKEEEDRYIAWECSVETFSREMQSRTEYGNTKYPFVIIELGCGLRVPSVRLENECVLLDCDQSFLIRINVGQEELDTIHNEELKPLRDERILCIQGGCENILKEIDNEIEKILNFQ
ncbi:hypothetical protein C9374_010259 [Naegleria lovaniensis]|uniref:Deacetylase sirtuin-type domain-containing protein n=1 Tax=Naegleria lovaniensis TaxID=51637 RepID=A0AA88KDP6_NAELO|nr:uncharacterized protein C9374_010259 [Naegleria lovaniensis]KAG2374885.1 hypothetical protein C9374_010259 [Naegleria lovaniensis]